ncbi:MAG: nicotinate-nucleotide adenylyltransferase [Bacillota bacterium]
MINIGSKAQNGDKVGIMGGTFDPIHFGHLVTAEAARHQFQLQQVIFIPAARPPHKTNRRISPPERRLAMTRLAVQSNPHFQVSDLEIARPGPSYTIDTVAEVRRKYPGADVYFITGADAVLEILTWYRVEELLTTCKFIAATRPGYRLKDLTTVAGLPVKYRQNICVIEVPALAISSTDIRLRVGESRPIKYLLPEPVEDYICREKLYLT